MIASSVSAATTTRRRPLIVVPGRFSDSASALRYRAVVNARALTEAVLRAGGEPLTVHPWAPHEEVGVEEVAARLSFADGILLPGGGDVDPALYGETIASGEVYDLDAEQDTFDLAVAQWALAQRVPLLAVCRGLQVVNVALGGTLEQHMDHPHRHTVDTVAVTPGSLLADIVGPSTTVSCYHHQRVGVLGDGLVVTGSQADGTPEAVETNRGGWFLGVQWHPEDTAAGDADQHGVFVALVEAARDFAERRAPV